MNRTQSIFAGLIGHALEYYDVMLYGFFSAIISPLFFPSENPLVTTFASVSSFAAGFVMRPVGSIFFGHLGDRLGRKKALTLSIFLVIIPTFLIGILPTYDQIGIWAPILLITCRLLQGFCLGGEVGGAITYILEHCAKGKEGYSSSLLEMSCYIGALLGTVIGFICTLSFFPEWSWRLPFLMGALFGIVGFQMRRKIEETEVFEKLDDTKKGSAPFLEIIKSQKLNFLRALGVCLGFIMPFYIITTYTNEILKTDLDLSPSSILGLNSGLMFFWILLLPLMGKLSDRIGIRKQMCVGALILSAVSYPAFVFVENNFNIYGVFSMQIILSLFVIIYSAPFGAVFTSLFPPNSRYSGIGMAYSLGAALFGGLAPLISVTLVQWSGDMKSPVILLVLSGIIGFISVFSFKKMESKNKNLKQTQAPILDAA